MQSVMMTSMPRKAGCAVAELDMMYITILYNSIMTQKHSEVIDVANRVFTARLSYFARKDESGHL